MSNHYGTDDELRSITFRDEADEDDYRSRYGQDRYGRQQDPYGTDPYGQDPYGGGPGGPYDDDPPGGSGDVPPTDRRRGRNKTKTTLLVLLALVLMLGGGLVLTGYLISENIGNKATRENTFNKIPESQRAPEATTEAGKNAINILLAGTDGARDGQKTTGDGATEGLRSGKRSDTIMLVHITADRKSAYLISIPRDTYVEIPGRSKNKINAAYAFGGSALYVNTVEQLTGIRMQHYAAIDWAGFKDLTDALDGVSMYFAEPTKLASGKTVPAGQQTLTGDEALDYVRDRKHLAGGDFDRIKRQQNFLRSLMKQTLSGGTLTNPIKLTHVLEAVASNLAVDEAFTNGEMRSLATQLAGLRPTNVTFMTIPLANPKTGMVGSQSVVFMDQAKSKGLFDAVREDKTAEWIAKNNPDLLPKKVN